MTANGWLQIALFALAVLLVTRPLGRYLVAVYEGRVRWLAPVERLLYRAAGVDPAAEQHWTGYAAAMLIWAENRAGGGAAFRFSLPITGPPPQLVTEETAWSALPPSSS